MKIVVEEFREKREGNTREEGEAIRCRLRVEILSC